MCSWWWTMSNNPPVESVEAKEVRSLSNFGARANPDPVVTSPRSKFQQRESPALCEWEKRLASNSIKYPDISPKKIWNPPWNWQTVCFNYIGFLFLVRAGSSRHVAVWDESSEFCTRRVGSLCRTAERQVGSCLQPGRYPPTIRS